jgi:hypothetical protein
MVTLAIRAVRAGAILAALFGFVAAAQAQTPSPAQVKLARQVVELSAASRVFDAAVPTVFQQIYSTYIQQNPDLSKEIAGVLQSLIPEFDKRKEEIVGILAQTYAQKFTEAELNDLLAFYNSPTGKKLISQGGEIGRDSYAKVQEWSGKMLQQLTDRLKAEMKKKGHTI